MIYIIVFTVIIRYEVQWTRNLILQNLQLYKYLYNLHHEFL